MLHPQFILLIAHELVVDLFAGGGVSVVVLVADKEPS